MIHYIDDELVYYNAYYSIQDLTRVLSTRDICTFLNYLETAVRIATNGTDKVIFDTDEDYFFDTHRDSFMRIDEWILYNDYEITSSEIDLINCPIEFDTHLEVAFMATRIIFRDFINDRINSGLSEENKLRSVLF